MNLLMIQDRDLYAPEREPENEQSIRRPSSLHQQALVTSHFETFTATVTDLVYELLETPVLVTDADGNILAASRAEWKGSPLNTIEALRLRPHIEVPLCLGSEFGRLHIYQESEDETTLHLTEKIAHLAIDQVLLAEQLPTYHKLKDKFLYNLLYGLISDTSLIGIHAQQLELDLSPPRAVILVDASSYIMDNVSNTRNTTGSLQMERRVNSVINCIVDFFSLPNDTICAYMGQGEIAVLKATDTKNLVNWADGPAASTSPSWANLAALKRASQLLLSVLNETLHASFTVSIGRHHPGIIGLSHSYKDALAALSLGLRFYGANRVHCLDELGVAAFVGISDERIKGDLAAHILSPLDHEPELIDTLRAFFDSNCSPTQASTHLSIHRNTLNYRLEKIASLTGLDPRQFDDAVQIRLALLLRSP